MLALQGRVLESSVFSQDYKLKTFHPDTAAQIVLSCMRAIVCLHCCLNCLCVRFIALLAQCFHVVLTLICFIFVMRFGNSLDVALLDYQRDLVCLFSSEAHGDLGPKPGEHFNYNHSITTLCFKVREVGCRKGSGGENACPQ